MCGELIEAGVAKWLQGNILHIFNVNDNSDKAAIEKYYSAPMCRPSLIYISAK